MSLEAWNLQREADTVGTMQVIGTRCFGTDYGAERLIQKHWDTSHMRSSRFAATLRSLAGKHQISVVRFVHTADSEVTALAKFVLSGARTEPLICFPFGGRSVDTQFEAHTGVKSIW